jgi:multicomponent Na+:H+ antiporter subunit D
MGKLLPPAYSRLPAFLLWAGGTAALLLLSAPEVLSPSSITTALGGWREPWGIELELNGVSWTITLLGLLLGMAAWAETARQPEYGPGFYFFFYMLLFSLNGVVGTRDFFNLFVLFEVLSLCSFVLIAYERHTRALLASYRYLLISTVSIVLFLLGLWILYQASGSLSVSGISALLAEAAHQPRFGLAAALITAGALTRSAALPFHSWLPEAHGSAPYPVSALLSGLVIKAPVVALLHVLTDFPFPNLRLLLLAAGALGALFGGLAALVQRDVKLILAYSSISHMGIIIALFGAGDSFSTTALILYVTAHAVGKALLFLTVGAAAHHRGTRDLRRLRGSLLRLPLHGAAAIIGICTLTGIPFTAGYQAKLLAMQIFSSPALSLLFQAAGVVSAAALLRLFTLLLPAARVSAGTGSRRPSSPGDSAGSPPAADSRPASTPPAAGSFFSSAAGSPPAAGKLLLAGCSLLIGLFPDTLLSIASTLAAGATAGPSHFIWYGGSDVLKSAAVILAGAVIAAGASLPVIQSFLRNTGCFRVGLNGSLRLFLVGAVLFIAVGVL